MLTKKLAATAVGIIAYATASCITVVAQDGTATVAANHPVPVASNLWLFAWVIFGAVLGGYVAVAISRSFKTSELAASQSFTYAAVATATSISISPYFIAEVIEKPTPEICIMAAFVAASISWMAWEIGIIIWRRMRDAAFKKGISGIKEELKDLAKPGSDT